MPVTIEELKEFIQHLEEKMVQNMEEYNTGCEELKELQKQVRLKNCELSKLLERYMTNRSMKERYSRDLDRRILRQAAPDITDQ